MGSQASMGVTATTVADNALTPPCFSSRRCHLFCVVIPLGIALVASLLMSLAQIDAVELPGCGSVSDCSQAAASSCGSVPGIDWPLSYVGCAYFQALAAALFFGSGRLPRLLWGIVASGAIVSLGLIGVMFTEGYLCGYCLTIHAANLVLATHALRQLWRTRHVGGRIPGIATMICFVAIFAATSALLVILDYQTLQASAAGSESTLQEVLSLATTSPEIDDQSPLFARGRYVLGPESAQVHVTIVSDYQCPTCRRIDAQLRAIIAGRDDVSISARHFPFCTDCNEHIDKTSHSNACRAAIAAEAAGMSGGPEAFWKMHDWLFEHAGQFTDEELIAQVNEMGLDLPRFQSGLASPETLEFIRADTDAANAAGLKFTPMIFINGREIDVGKTPSN